MLTTPKALLAFWLLIAIVNSTPRPSAQNFDSNSDAEPPVNTSLDGLSYNDDSMASAALTNTFGSDLTADSNPIGDQENLFAGNIRAGDSCRAEDAQSVSAIGRLRRREGSQSVPGEGKTCVSPAAGASNEPLDPFLLQLPQVEEVVAPAVVGRLDICPPLVFGDRDIPLCSLAPPQELINKGVSTLVVINAVVCMYQLISETFHNRRWQVDNKT